MWQATFTALSPASAATSTPTMCSWLPHQRRAHSFFSLRHFYFSATVCHAQPAIEILFQGKDQLGNQGRCTSPAYSVRTTHPVAVGWGWQRRGCGPLTHNQSCRPPETLKGKPDGTASQAATMCQGRKIHFCKWRPTESCNLLCFYSLPTSGIVPPPS